MVFHFRAKYGPWILLLMLGFFLGIARFPQSHVTLQSHAIVDKANQNTTVLEQLIQRDVYSGFEFRPISDIGDGNSLHVEVSENFVFVASGAGGLRIYDNTGGNLALVSEIDWFHEVKYVEIANDLAFLAAEKSGLVILNVSDPTSPTVISQFESWNDPIRKVIYDAGKLYVHSWSSLSVYQVENDGSIIFLGKMVFQFADFDVFDGYVFTVNYDTLYLIDAQDPTSLVQKGGSDLGITESKILINGTLAYVGSASEGFVVVDVSNPTSITNSQTLQIVATYPATGMINEFDVMGKYLLVANSSHGLEIFDMSNPSSPAHVGTFANVESATAVRANGSRVFVGNWWNGIIEVNLSTPSSPALVQQITGLGFAHDVDVKGDLAIVANSGGGIALFNISNYYHPRLLGRLSLAEVSKIELADRIAFALTDTDSIHVVNVTVPSSPSLVSTITSTGNVRSTTFVDNLLFVGHSKGLEIYNVSSPESPILLGSYLPSPLFSVRSILVEGNTAFLLGATELRVVDVSDFTSISVIGTIGGFSSTLSELAKKASALFIMGSDGLKIIDASDPSNPVLRKELFPNDIGYAVDVEHDVLVLADVFDGIRIMNVSDPYNPLEMGTYEFVDALWDIKLRQPYMFLADGYGGMRILKVERAAGPSITNITYSPFPVFDNSTIMISANVEDPSGVEQVSLHYRVGNADWVIEEMTPDSSSSRTYFQVFDPLEAFSQVQFYVSARDHSFQHWNTTADNNGGLYNFVVLPENPPTVTQTSTLIKTTTVSVETTITSEKAGQEALPYSPLYVVSAALVLMVAPQAKRRKSK